MIHEQDLIDAIAECQGEREPNAGTCIKLAAFLTIKNALYPEAKPPAAEYLQASSGGVSGREPIVLNTVSEFSEAVRGRDASEIMPVMDELMETLRLIHPRLYNGVLEKLK